MAAEYNRIDKLVLVGSVYALEDRALMARVGGVVSAIIWEEWDPRVPEGVPHLDIRVRDSPDADIESHFRPVYAFIMAHATPQHPVLVHCYAGVSRSATLAMYYWARRYHVTWQEAYSSVSRARPRVQPNRGFVLQLRLALSPPKVEKGQDRVEEL